MGKTPRDAEALLPLTPAVFHILLALVDRERHGYGIMQEILARTDGQFKIGPGTLYGSIKRMLADGLLEESGERPDTALDDERRRYYRLTDFGQRVAHAEARRLAALVRVAQLKHLLFQSPQARQEKTWAAAPPRLLGYLPDPKRSSGYALDGPELLGGQ